MDLNGDVIVDFIGKYENLQGDFDAVCKRIGVATPTLGHKKKSTDRSKDYRSYYDDECVELVAKQFARDIEILGYTFDPSETGA